MRARLRTVLPLLLVLAAPARADHLNPGACDTGIPSDESVGWRAFPKGDVFCPLLADPKREGSFASWLWAGQSVFGDQIGAIGLGDRWNLARWNGPAVGEGVQLSLTANVFSQFNVRIDTYDLLNADYVVALPLTWRRGPWSARLRAYHQSSHFGEGFANNSVITDQNYAYESADALLSVDVLGLRLYGGYERLLDVRPVSFRPSIVRGGGELHTPPLASSGPASALRVVAGVDAKAAEELEWSTGISVRAGFEVGRQPKAEHRSQAWQLLAEWYDGPQPYGQFLRERTRYFGIGLHLGP
jgi:hypothetical protein